MKEFKQIRFMDINSKNKELWKQLPLDIPSCVYIDPTNLCNYHCPFCPTGNSELIHSVHRPFGMMDMEVYKKILSDLWYMVKKHGKKIERVHFYKDGEPLLNPNFPLMLKLARESEIAESLETTTNASLLTPELSENILSSGLNVIRISVESVNNNYYSLVSNGKITYEKIKDNVAALFSKNKEGNYGLHIHAKIIDSGLTKEDLEKFKNDFINISDSWNINTINKWPGCGICGYPFLETNFVGEKDICSEPFTKLAINFDGTVSACCVDWSHGAIFGDITKESMENIWNGKKINEFRKQHLLKQRSKISICYACNYVDGLPNLDLYNDYLMNFYC